MLEFEGVLGVQGFKAFRVEGFVAWAVLGLKISNFRRLVGFMSLVLQPSGKKLVLQNPEPPPKPLNPLNPQTPQP